ncbi:hypothetical protein WJX74_007434 [Apatococcus lobatus]|uniref:Small ribosomal subunit protein mS35 mitochondrial conserved domain-containing protein n=1 Tax=Apatococcus lobatus TaxID=904363 RepID=A0AAW1RMU4_9CHLO
MHRLVRALLRGQQPQQMLLIASNPQPCVLLHEVTSSRLQPDLAVSLATRSFASGSTDGLKSAEEPASSAQATGPLSEEGGEEAEASRSGMPQTAGSQEADDLAGDLDSLSPQKLEAGMKNPAKGPSGLNWHIGKNNPRGYTAWDEMRLDKDVAEKVRQRGKRKWTRELKGSYVDNKDLMAEMDAIAPEIPSSLPIYNIDELMPWACEPESKAMDAMAWLQQNAPDLAELCVDQDNQDDAPFPGARPILRWSMTAVLSMNHAEFPADKNKKTKCAVYLRDLQQQARPPLTLAALHHIAAIAGPRYNPKKGELTLTSEKYPHREANRNHIMQMLRDLVAEGHKVMGAEGVPMDSQEPVQPVPQDPEPDGLPPAQQTWRMPRQGATVVWMNH